ncbi:MAG: type IV secretion system DNA-binding domain-containing protein [Gemmataceae bacterium]
MLFLLSAPAQNERGPRYMEKALAAIHQSHLHDPVTLGYGSMDGQIALWFETVNAHRELVLGPIAANYPQCAIHIVESNPIVDSVRESWCIDIRLIPELFPLLRHAQFEDLLNHTFADPLSSLLRAIKPDDEVDCRVEIEIVPASHRRRHEAAEAVKRLDREFFRHHHHLASFYARIATGVNPFGPGIAWFMGRLAIKTAHHNQSALETSTSRLHEREVDLQAAADKIGCHLFETKIRLIAETKKGQEALARERLQAMLGAIGAFTRSRLARFKATAPKRLQPCMKRPSFLLSHEELATLWHPPTSSAGAEKMSQNEFVELEAPTKLPSGQEDREAGIVVLGQVRFRDDQRLVSLAREDRRRHLHIVGKTGMGKTTLLQTLIAADMRTGRGVCIVDPHGDLAESLVGMVPKNRTNDTIVFDAGSREGIVGFNPLACRDPSRVDQVTSGVVTAFKKLNDSWGPRLEDTLRNAVFATVEQGGNLSGLMRLLGEKPFRERMVMTIRDEMVRSFWLNEFASWSDNYRTEAVAAIQNKIRPFLTNTNIRAIVSQSGAGIDLREVMDSGQILIVNLSKGRVGEDNSTLLGAFLVTCIQQAAMTRADIPEAERRDFYLYIDEFQNFVSGSFATILSEARKFRLSLTVAHQYLTQLDEETTQAVWGNVGSVISFQVGANDAEVLAQQLGKFAGQIAPESLTGLPKYTAYARLLIDGMPSPPFSMRTLPPTVASDPERAEIVRRTSQRRFGSLLPSLNNLR